MPQDLFHFLYHKHYSQPLCYGRTVDLIVNICILVPKNSKTKIVTLLSRFVELISVSSILHLKSYCISSLRESFIRFDKRFNCNADLEASSRAFTKLDRALRRRGGAKSPYSLSSDK